MTRLAIVGTQMLACNLDKPHTVRRVALAISKLKPDVVISGGAAGVDGLAAMVAKERGYSVKDGTLIIHWPLRKQWDGDGGYKWRNEKIAQDCTHLLRIACQRSTTGGSLWTAKRAEELGKVVVWWSPCQTA